MSKTLQSVIGDFTKSPIVSINVGNGVLFFLHKNLLTTISPVFFDGALNSHFWEAQNLSIELPEEDPEGFSLFFDWLYRGCIPPIKISKASEQSDNPESADSTTAYHRLYYMAEKWCLDALCDQAMDCIRAYHKASDKTVTTKLLVAGYKNTHEKSPLREYLCRNTAYGIYEKEDYVEMQEAPEILADVLLYYHMEGCSKGVKDPDEGDYGFYVKEKREKDQREKEKEKDKMKEVGGGGVKRGGGVV
ncbi:hypothetical protein MMC30_002137 [Trapelia coarctata]|nr:hypothetical protein [Trapelia coarctata]